MALQPPPFRSNWYKQYKLAAGDGNRTHVRSLGRLLFQTSNRIPRRLIQKEKGRFEGSRPLSLFGRGLDQLWTKTPAFCGPESALDSARAIESTRFMVGAVGIELLIKFTKSRVFTVLPTANQMNWSQM